MDIEVMISRAPCLSLRDRNSFNHSQFLTSRLQRCTPTTSPNSCCTCKAPRITTTSITRTTLSAEAWYSTRDVSAGLQIPPLRSSFRHFLDLPVTLFASLVFRNKSSLVAFKYIKILPCIITLTSFQNEKYILYILKRVILLVPQEAP